MKNYLLVIIIIMLSVPVYSQVVNEEITLEYINRCYNYLKKPVPNGFFSTGKTNIIRNGTKYENQVGDTFLYVANNVVYFSSFGLLFELTNAANRFHAMIIDALETTNWKYYGKTPFNDMDIYIKNNVGALVGPVRRRSSDKLLIVSVNFITEEDFTEMFDYP